MASAAEYEAFFDSVDADGSGTLTYNELKDFLSTKGYKEQQIKTMFATADSSGDNKVTKQEFLEAMGAAEPTVHSGSAMRTIFRGFDSDGNGTINRAELKKIWEEMGKVLSDEEAKKVMGWLDKDGDDTVNYEELCDYFQGSR